MSVNEVGICKNLAISTVYLHAPTEQKLHALCQKVGATCLKAILEQQLGIAEYVKLTPATLHTISHCQFLNIRRACIEKFNADIQQWHPTKYPSSIGQIPITSPYHPIRIRENENTHLRSLVNHRKFVIKKLQAMQVDDEVATALALSRIKQEGRLIDTAYENCLMGSEETLTEVCDYIRRTHHSYKFLADLWIKQGSLEQEIQILADKIYEFVHSDEQFARKEQKYFEYEMNWQNALAPPLPASPKSLTRNIGSLSIDCTFDEEPKAKAPPLEFFTPEQTTDCEMPTSPQQRIHLPRPDTPYPINLSKTPEGVTVQ